MTPEPDKTGLPPEQDYTQQLRRMSLKRLVSEHQGIQLANHGDARLFLIEKEMVRRAYLQFADIYPCTVPGCHEQAIYGPSGNPNLCKNHMPDPTCHK